MQVSAKDLARDDSHILFFRAAFDLGFSVERHMDELAIGLVAERMSSYVFLRDASPGWIDDHIRQLDGTSYNDHLQIIRANIRTATIANETLGPALKKIARSIKAKTAGQLARLLHDLSRETHALVGQALEKHGDATTTAVWKQCDVASLVFLNGPDAPTRCSFVRTPEDTINVHIGDHTRNDGDPRCRALGVFFSMQFYFFHEYLSHSFSRWQMFEFVDGYLVWAAKQMLYGMDPGSLRQSYVQAGFDAAARDDERLQDIERAASWLHFNTGSRFLPHLLAWAAEDGYTENWRDVRNLSYVASLVMDQRDERIKTARRAMVANAFSQNSPGLVRQSVASLVGNWMSIPGPTALF